MQPFTDNAPPPEQEIWKFEVTQWLCVPPTVFSNSSVRLKPSSICSSRHPQRQASSPVYTPGQPSADDAKSWKFAAPPQYKPCPYWCMCCVWMAASITEMGQSRIEKTFTGLFSRVISQFIVCCRRFLSPLSPPSPLSPLSRLSLLSPLAPFFVSADALVCMQCVY